MALFGLAASWQLLIGILFYDGRPYRQGDWLINTINQPIRRGPIGTMLINVSDWLQTTPVIATMLLQMLLFFILTIALFAAVYAFMRRPAYALLLTSPAFFPIYWVAEEKAAGRKELIVMTSMCLLLVIPLLPPKFRKPMAVFATLMFLFGCIGHELTVLLTPAFAVIFYITVQPDLRDRSFQISTAVFLAIVGTALIYALTYSRVEDYMTVCQPLLERGLQEKICEGAIYWLEGDLDYAWMQMEERFTLINLTGFALACVLITAPILYVISLHREKKMLFIALALIFLPIFPLFVVALDWGRWVSIIFSTFILLLMALSIQKKIHLERAPNTVLLYTVCITNMFWSPYVLIGFVPGGVVQRILT